MLLYGTGGLAWARAKFSIVGGASIAGGPNLPFAVSDTTNFVGWAAGVGGDWMFMPNWTVGVEYLHLDLGDANFKFSGPYPNATTTFVLGQGANISLVSDVVRGTLNYRF
jgi:outer membrane immunogenic protein